MFIPLKNVPGVESQVSGEHCHGDQRATAFHHRQSVSSEVSTSGGAVTFHPWSTPHHTAMATALEGELVRVVKTLEELQHSYLGLLEAEAEAGAEEAEAALRDYRLLTDKMLEWIVQCDNVTRRAALAWAFTLQILFKYS